MGEQAVSQCRVRYAGSYRNLDCRHDFAGVGSQRTKSQDAVTVCGHQGFQKTSCLRQGARTEDPLHRNLEQAIGRAVRSGFLFAQPNAREFRIGEKAERNLPAGRDALATMNAVMDYAEIVDANVRELRTI